MKTKLFIIVVIILEICFLSWTSFIDKQNQKTKVENILLEENTIYTVKLAVVRTDQTNIVSKATRERTYEADYNYLDLKRKRLSSLMMMPLRFSDENENLRTANILNQITHIDVSNNYLRVFPPYFLKMKKLKKVLLKNNRIKRFNQEALFYSKENTSIETVDLSNNDILYYSTNSLKLPNLQYLNLSNNLNLRNIYIGKGDFLKLKELNIRHTAVANNAEEIAELYKVLPSDTKIIY